ncbi:hypothetical protein TSUD_371450 [Trifolium subterraneum]|uniref:RRM domain-containing protein n=1 Tax=Trifolium subterraneum TaxID=3900 RepID=A0A2Z6PIR6_TRISU|nr:hypothetical protein TSUD_371450 [Trifolium subterraneum]
MGRGYSWDGYRYCDVDTVAGRVPLNSRAQLRSDHGRRIAVDFTSMELRRDNFMVVDGGAQNRKFNLQGKIYGFVRYSNVKDVGKLLNAINDISFGQSRIWAKLARFEEDYVRGEERVFRKNEGRGGGWCGSTNEGEKIRKGGHGKRVLGEGEKNVR